MITKNSLELQVITDDLTGLYNRRFLNEKLSQITDESKNKRDTFALIMLDMDHFKEVNDNYGHDEGDKALLWIADILRNSIRSGDIIIRFAGDEFFLILPGAKLNDAQTVTERIYNNIIRIPFRGSKGQVSVNVGISGGISIFPEDASSAEELLKSADLGLYLAKEQGRGKICLAAEAKFKKQIKIDRQIFLNPPFVGRKSELKSLKKSWFDVNQDKKNISTIIVGEQGIGKTRLIKEFLALEASKNTLYFQATCHRYELEIPYQIIIDLLNQWIEKNKPLFEKHFQKLPQRERAELLKILPHFEVDIQPLSSEKLEHDHSILYYALVDIYRSLSLDIPFIFIVDDIQWIDSASLDLLSHIIIQTSTHPIFLIIAIQASSTEKFNKFFRRIERESISNSIILSKLKPECFREIVRKIFNPETPHELFAVEEILCNESEGNPLFFRELLLKIVDEKILVNSLGKWSIDKNKTISMPEKVKDFVIERIESLDDEKKGILQKASIIGLDFFFEILRDISETNEGHLIDMIDTLISLGFIEEIQDAKIETYKFSSIYIQKAVYENINSPRKKRLHQKIMELLENEYHKKRGDFIEKLFYHAKHAKLYEKAFLYGVQGALKAYKNYGIKEAINYFNESFNIYGELIPELKELHNQLFINASCTYAEALILNGKYENAQKILINLPLTPKKLDLIGFINFKKGSYAEAGNLFEKAFLSTDDITLKSRIKSRLADIYYHEGLYDAAFISAKEANQLAIKSKSIAMEALALKLMGNVSIAEMKLNDAFNYYKQAIKRFISLDERAEIAGCLNNIGLCHYFKKRYRPALKTFFRAKKYCDEIELNPLNIKIHNNIGNVYLETDQLRLAEEYYTKSLNLSEDMGDIPVSIAALKNLGNIFEKTDIKKSETYFQKGLKLSQEIGEKSLEASFYIALGNLGDFDASETLYSKAIHIKKDLGEIEEEVFVSIKLLELYKKFNENQKFQTLYKHVINITKKFKHPLEGRQLQLVNGIKELE